MSFSDVSGASSHFSNAYEGFTTTTSGTVASGATVVGLNSVTGLTNGSIFVGVIEPAATKEQVFTGTVDTSGSRITGVVWTKGTNIEHAAGVTVVDYDTGTHHNLMKKGILVQHAQDGSHGVVTATSVTTPTLTVTSGSTFPAGDIGTADIAALAVNNSKLASDISPAKFSNPYKFSVYRNSAWSLSSSATIVSFDTKLYDTGSNFDVTTNHYFTAPVAGFYQFDACITATGSSGANNNGLIYLSVNAGVGTIIGGWNMSAQSNVVAGSGGKLLQLSANDTVQLQVLNSQTGISGGTGAANAWFSGFLVSAT